MFTLTYETIEGRPGQTNSKVRGVISNSSKGYPEIFWVGEVFANDAAAIKRMKRVAKTAFKELTSGEDNV